MKYTNYSKNNLETWPSLFKGFYSMSKMFWGQARNFKKFYNKDNNYTELVDGVVTLQRAKNVGVKKLGLIGYFKSTIYLLMLKGMLYRLKVDLDIPKVGYPFIVGNVYQIGYSTNKIFEDREYLTYVTVSYEDYSLHPYSVVNMESVKSVKILK